MDDKQTPQTTQSTPLVGNTPVVPPPTPAETPVPPTPAPVVPPNPTPTPAPAVPKVVPPQDPTPTPPSASGPQIQVSGAKPKVIISSGSHRNAFLLGILAVFLFVGLVAGVYLVRQQQTVRSRATGCDMRWPAKPGTTCGQTTQLPAEGATVTTLTPNFHWDYGGYRSEDNGQCVQPSGCTNYQAAVLLWDFHPTGSSSKPFASAVIPGLNATQPTPVKDAKFSDFRVCDYGNIFPNDPNTCHTDGKPSISPLKPDTDYWWTVTPYFDGTVHAEQTWNYHFKTGPAPTAACQLVSADKDLTKINIGDTVKFTGYGSVSSGNEKIDKINFILTKDNAPFSDNTVDTVRATDKDTSGSQFYVATQSATINAAGTYKVRIRVHWQSADQWLE